MHRKIYTFIIGFVILSFSLQAQDYFGIKGGGNVSNTPLRLESENVFILDQQKLSFFLVGLTYEKKLSKNFSLLSSLDITKQGSILEKRNQDGSDVFYNANEISYLKLSLKPKISFKFSDYYFFMALGPSISRALNGNFKIFRDDDFETVREDLDFEKWKISKTDFGINSSMGIEKLVANKVKVQLGVEYYLGLFDISNQNEMDIFNESISIFIGASLPISKEKS